MTSSKSPKHTPATLTVGHREGSVLLQLDGAAIRLTPDRAADLATLIRTASQAAEAFWPEVKIGELGDREGFLRRLADAEASLARADVARPPMPAERAEPKNIKAARASDAKRARYYGAKSRAELPRVCSKLGQPRSGSREAIIEAIIRAKRRAS